MPGTPRPDLRRTLLGYAAAKGRIEVLTLPVRRYLAVDGQGDPNTGSEYRDALATLYPMAYRVRALSVSHLGRDYRIMPLEALWWADDLDAFTAARDKSVWHWQVLNLVPDWVGEDLLAQARATLAAAGRGPMLDRLQVVDLDEGQVVQTLHVGSYDDEGPLLERVHAHITEERGLRLAGRHHEIYLNDARRTAPGRLRTILRQPVTG